MSRFSPEEIEEMRKWADSHGGRSNSISNAYYTQYIDPYDVSNLVGSANSSNVMDVMSQISGNSDWQKALTPYQEKQLDNLASQFNAQHDLINQAEQLQTLGLSSGNVTQTGGSMAHNVTDNTSQAREQRKLEASGQKIGLAKSFIGLAGSLASSGIHAGTALAGVKGAASRIASNAASSALRALYR